MSAAGLIPWAIEALIASTVLMVAVLCLRGVVRRSFGPDIAYALWALPALRMLLPPLPQSWREIAPFDVSRPGEVAARAFVLNLAAMKRQHLAYLGSEEPQARSIRSYREEANQRSAPLSISIVPGDHASAVAPAIRAFIAELGSRSASP
jgi:hypothetical protein